MSRRRYISTDISLDPEVNRLAAESDFAALLYTWMIPHAEDDATITANPSKLLYKVCPARRDKTEDDVADALKMFIACDVIEAIDDVNVYFKRESFYRIQSYVKAERRRITPGSDLAQNAEERRKTPKNAASFIPSFRKNSCSSKRDERYTDEFTAFWQSYPRKQSKGQAARAFKGARKRASLQELTDGLQRAIAHDSRFRERQYTPLASSWLNADGWTDEHQSSDVELPRNLL